MVLKIFIRPVPLQVKGTPPTAVRSHFSVYLPTFYMLASYDTVFHNLGAN